MDSEMVKALLVGTGAIAGAAGVTAVAWLQYRQVRADLAANTHLTQQVLITVDGPLRQALARLATTTQQIADLSGVPEDQVKANAAQQALADHDLVKEQKP